VRRQRWRTAPLSFQAVRLPPVLATAGAAERFETVSAGNNEFQLATETRDTKGRIQNMDLHYPETACEPKVVYEPYYRVVDWGMPADADAGDITFAVIEAAMAAGASEVQLTLAEWFDDVNVHFRMGSDFIPQAALTRLQFGLIAILLPHISIPALYGSESTRFIRLLRSSGGFHYYLRFSKFRVSDRSTAILIRLFLAGGLFVFDTEVADLPEMPFPGRGRQIANRESQINRCKY
jgi:hypothetical protein